MLKERMLSYIREKRLILPGEHILSACSGGADSVCLLLLLCDLSDELGIRVTAVHVHHGIRKGPADRDADFTKALSERLGIGCIVKRVDVPAYREAERLSEEEAARELRYRALREVLEETGADRIAAAHHLEDQAETVLFNMIRGSGVRGLSGMRPENGVLIRPLLPFTREEIISELGSRGQDWCEDETNDSDRYSRNMMRKNVLPALRELRPDAVRKISETASAMAETEDFFREETEKWIRENTSDTADGLRFPLEPFCALHPVMRQEVLRTSLRAQGFRMKDRTRKNFQDMAALCEKEVGKRCILNGEGELVREYESLLLKREDPDRTERTEEADTAGAESTEMFSGIAGLIMETRVFPFRSGMAIPSEECENIMNFKGKECTKWFDYDKIKQLPVLRTRQTGDRFSTRAGTHKKLKDVLIDEKVPRAERDRLPIVAAGSEVLWMIGIRMNEDCKVTEKTREVLEVTIRGAEL